MQKTLCFSFDGIGNEPCSANQFAEDESISNVLKLHLLMGGSIGTDNSYTKTLNDGIQQTYYYNGIGARYEGQSRPLLGKLLAWGTNRVSDVVQLGLANADDILREAMEDLKQEGYSSNDRLAIFGFSRGAALARVFAYRVATELHRKVSFLGIFDTVRALARDDITSTDETVESVDSDIVFQDYPLHQNIERVVHLLALDENREWFTPQLMNAGTAHPERILEVWFPGIHGDIGGGYWLDGLSDLALEFMIKRCEVTLKQDIYICSGKHLGGISQLFANQQSGQGMGKITKDDVAIYPMLNGPIHHHNEIKNEAPNKPRTVYVSDNGASGEQEHQLPLLHWSVKEHFDRIADYRPAALRGVKFRLLLPNGRVSIPIEGISELRKYTLPS